MRHSTIFNEKTLLNLILWGSICGPGSIVWESVLTDLKQNFNFNFGFKAPVDKHLKAEVTASMQIGLSTPKNQHYSIVIKLLPQH